MDWNKAKNILLIVFLILNVFLFYLNITNSSENVPAKVIEDAKKVLEERGIVLDNNCKIPNETGFVKVMDFEIGQYKQENILDLLFGKGSKNKADDGRYVSETKKIKFYNNNSIMEYIDNQPNENVDISKLSSIEDYLSKFILKLKLPQYNYKIFEYNNNGQEASLVLKALYKNFLIFDNWIEVKISKSGVTYFKHRYINVKDLKNGNKRIIPAYIVLISEFISELIKEAEENKKNRTEVENQGHIPINQKLSEIDVVSRTITDIGLCYEVNIEEDTNLYTNSCPKWYIKTLDGKIRKFNASE